MIRTLLGVCALSLCSARDMTMQEANELRDREATVVPTILTSEIEVDNFEPTEEKKVIAYCVSRAVRMFLDDVADKDRTFSIGIVEDEAVCGVKKGRLAMVQSKWAVNEFEQPVNVYGGGHSKGELMAWLTAQRHALLPVLTPRLYPSVTYPVVMVFSDFDPHSKESKFLRKQLLPVAQRFREEGLNASFVHVPQDHATDNELRFLDWEADDNVKVGLFASEQHLDKYRMEDEFSPSALASFVQSYYAHSAVKYLRSQKKPTTQDPQIHTVVGSTFTELVLHQKFDGLLLAYTSYAGKQHMPAFVDFCKQMAGHMRLQCKKINVMANDLPAPYANKELIKLFFVPQHNSSVPHEFGEINEDSFSKEKITKWAKTMRRHRKVRKQDPSKYQGTWGEPQTPPQGGAASTAPGSDHTDL